MYMCKNGSKILTELPLKKGIGANINKMVIDYQSMVGMCFDVEYKGEIYNNVEILEYINGSHPRFIIKYNDTVKANGFMCSKFISGQFKELLGLINHDYKYSVNEIINGFKILKKGYNNDKIKAYNVSCTKCGFDGGKHYRKGELVEEYWITENHLNRGDKCPCCRKSPQIVVQGINDIYTTDYWMVELGVDEEFAKTHTRSSGEKALCRCPNCGNTTQHRSSNTIYNYKSIGCSRCGDGFSYPEKLMYNVLNQLMCEFETQYSPDYLILNGSQKRSDFYISSLNLVIETDGGIGHKGGTAHSKSNKTIEEFVAVDKWKDEQHLKYGIKTIRINCFESNLEYIKSNILNSELINYFNLDMVNWDKANEFAWFSNLKKEVCDYWSNKEDWETILDIVKIFKFSRTTVNRYIKAGNKLGWCKYNPKEEMARSGIKTGKLNSKTIEIYKDGISLGMFKSATDLERQSEELFGVKLLQPNISAVCLGKKYIYKGFVFNYV